MFQLIKLPSYFAAMAFTITMTLYPVQASDEAIDAALENEFRTVTERKRDKYRHPSETLKFFGIRPDMHVAELNPGGGWYSRVLAPLLKDKGVYVGLEYNPKYYEGKPKYVERLTAYPEKHDAARDMYGANAVAAWFPAEGDLPVAEGSLDAVIAVRTMHNWVRRSLFDRALIDMHKMLKNGGVLGVVQHRMPEAFVGDRHASVRLGRWKQTELIAAIESYGFKLVGTSEVNANPLDKANYPSGVWSLPPVLHEGEETRTKYEQIGESDRMTLKFIKTID